MGFLRWIRDARGFEGQVLVQVVLGLMLVGIGCILGWW